MKPIIDDKTVYFCIDIEASGPVPSLFNMISIGCTVVKWNPATQKHVLGDEFYYEIKPDFPGFEKETIDIHHLTPEHLNENGLSSTFVLAEIEKFVKAQTPIHQKALFVGHNAPFDWMFVAFYFAWAGMKNPFGYNALDTKALAMGRLEIPWRYSNKEVLYERFPKLKPTNQPHHALEDARYQAQILVALLDGKYEG
jgi:DNA polymerase III epsilon subunit-like protein